MRKIMQGAKQKNIDPSTVASFGDEWSRFDQSNLSLNEQNLIFSQYFAVFPWDKLPPNAEGFDMGCGTGRWAKLCAPRVGKLNCIDPAAGALDVARKNLAGQKNVIFYLNGVDDNPLPQASQDFGYSLGVLHHIPDTQAALNSCVKMLKPSAPFLVYLYYSFDNRPLWFRAIWKLSDFMRIVICTLPNSFRSFVTDIIATVVYWPLARISTIFAALGVQLTNLPLYAYRNKSFYSMRTDSRDRFGTPLEQRFSCAEINEIMEKAGLTNIVFSSGEPFWCAVGYRVELA
jgi:SAM-dependent methyltransferase